jgi:gluconolactonase
MNVKVFLDKYQGQQFNSPNDLVFAADGALYFTDPPYGFFDPTRAQQGSGQGSPPRHQVQWRLPLQGRQPDCGDHRSATPQRLAFSRDGKIFYVANSENPPSSTSTT